jgi:hypothetical protein
MEGRRWWWNATKAEPVGWTFSCHFGWRTGQWKRERGELGVSLKRPPLAQPMQQLTKKTVSTKGGGIFYKIWPCQNVGGGQLTVVLDGNLVHEKKISNYTRRPWTATNWLKHTPQPPNQPYQREGGVCDEPWPPREVWGGLFHVVWGCEW